MIFGKSAGEIVWGALFIALLVFVSGLGLLCLWGMCSRELFRYLLFALVVLVAGIPLLAGCATAMNKAAIRRRNREIVGKRNTEMMMHFENKTIITQSNGETIIVQVMPGEAALQLRKDNHALRQLNSDLEQAIRQRNRQLAEAKKLHNTEMQALRDKFDRCHDDYKHCYRLLCESRELRKEEERQWRSKIEISHLEHLELKAWRKTEKARKKRDDRLRARIAKIRRRAKVNALLDAGDSLAALSGVERECSQSLEISNAVIALMEYLRPHNPTEEMRVYLWDCRTVEALMSDMRDGIVGTAFGGDWETRILVGLIGLNIVRPAFQAATVPDKPKPRNGKPGRKKHPAQ